jgi:Leucine-rich repeat (LRR) protein
LPHLAPLGRLRRLTLDKNHWSSDDIVKALAEVAGENLDVELLGDCSRELQLNSMPAFPALQYVSATYSILDESSIEALARQEKLRTLRLIGTNVEDSWLRHFVGSKLDALSLSETDVSVEGLALIVNMPTLTELRMERMSMSGDDLSVVGKAKGLQVLTLDHTPFSKHLVEAVCSLSNLEYLQFTNSGLRDPDVARLKALPRLKTLDVTGNPVSTPMILDIR